jgi:hypothetical protein
MKRFLFAAVLLILALPLCAQVSDRAMTLAPNGTLYTVESFANTKPSNEILSARYLTLTIQNGSDIIKTDVPATLTGGSHFQPEIAIDADSNTILIFWLHSANVSVPDSELEFCTYENGRWNDPVLVDDTPYHVRTNLRLGVTRKLQSTDDSGNPKLIDGLTVHAVWWDASVTGGETARYAMLSVEGGIVTSTYRRDLLDFVNRAYLRGSIPDPDNIEVLRHPIVYESPEHDTVDILFGDLSMNLFHRITLKPVADTRVRIPIGIREASYPTPLHRMTSQSARLSAISTSPDRLALYYSDKDAVRYLRFERGVWGSNSVELNKEVSADAAIAALRKLVSGD